MRMLLVALACLAYGCGGGGGTVTSPTPTPRPSPTPAPTPAPAPALPNFSGSWLGEYSVTSCTTTGSASRVVQLCKEDFRVGRELPVRATWTQTGRDVRGTISYGGYVSGLEGNTIANNILAFNATATTVDTRVTSTTTVRSSRDGFIDEGGTVELTLAPLSGGGTLQLRGSIRSMVRL